MHHSKAQTHHLLPHSKINSTTFKFSLLWTATDQQFQRHGYHGRILQPATETSYLCLPNESSTLAKVEQKVYDTFRCFLLTQLRNVMFLCFPVYRSVCQTVELS
jgi:hypothetical protein